MKLPHKDAVQSTLWTIERPYTNHTERLIDDLTVLDYYDENRRFTYPLQIKFIRDKNDLLINDPLYDYCINKIVYFENDMWAVTHNKWLFNDYDSAIEYLVNNILIEYKQIFEDIINGEDLRIIQSKKALELIK